MRGRRECVCVYAHAAMRGKTCTCVLRTHICFRDMCKYAIVRVCTCARACAHGRAPVGWHALGWGSAERWGLAAKAGADQTAEAAGACC